MIPTFIFNDDDRHIYLNSNEYKTLDISPSSNLSNSNNTIKLYESVNWAIRNDEDFIYCVCGPMLLTDFDLDELEIILRDVLPQEVYMLYVEGRYQKSIPVNRNCMVVYGVEELHSFLVTKPIYNDIISLIEQISKKMISISFLELLGLSNPHSISLSSDTAEMNCKVNDYLIHIISPFRNAAQFIKCHFDSIYTQTYRNFHIHYIDDASNDHSLQQIPETTFISKNRNSIRKYALQNIIDVLLNNTFSDDDIVCFVDADDYLPHKYVLGILNQVYQQEETLITYGSMQNHNGRINIGSAYSIEEFENIRKSPWRVSHIRSFRYRLFKEYLKADPNFLLLRDDNGKILRMPYDMALLFPLLELVSYEQLEFLPNLMYKYRLHPFNDMHKTRDEQLLGEKIIRTKDRIYRSNA